MSDGGVPATDPRGPTLFRQIAARLAILTLLFAALDVGIVVVTYSRQPEALAQELLNLEAEKADGGAILPAELLAGPPGARRWSVRYIGPEELDSAPNAAPATTPAATLVDWTRRDLIADGFRISGVRTVGEGAQRRWISMQFEGNGFRPYAPVIINEIMQHVMLPLIPLSLLLFLFNVFAVRRVLQPLQRAEAEVDALDPENALMRLSEAKAPREVSALVRAVNRALARVERSMDVLKGFTANAAHELRTPLSIMQLSLDRLPKGKLRDDLQSDTRHMTRLVEQMLDLAQADALATDGHTQVELADIGRGVVATLAPAAFAAGRDLRFDDHGNTTTQGHPEAIFRIYRNLIDNALAHAPGTTPIEVAAGPGPELTVRDYGPGISEADLPHLFDRFWRGDRRTSAGAGLGLGIVQRLAEAHGGHVAVENPPGGGALFRVTFPPSRGDAGGRTPKRNSETPA